MSPTLKATVENAARTLGQTQYVINLAVSNILDTFDKKLTAAGVTQLSAIQKKVLYILQQPAATLIQNLRAIFQKAANIQKIKGKVGGQLLEVLKPAVEDGIQCVHDLGITASSELIKKTAAVTLANQNVMQNFHIFLFTMQMILLLLSNLVCS